MHPKMEINGINPTCFYDKKTPSTVLGLKLIFFNDEMTSAAARGDVCSYFVRLFLHNAAVAAPLHLVYALKEGKCTFISKNDARYNWISTRRKKS